MTFLPSNVQIGACSSSRMRSLKCVPLALSSLSWSVRYVSGLVRVAVVMKTLELLCHGFRGSARIDPDQCNTPRPSAQRHSEHNRVSGRDARLTQLLHAGEKFFLGLGQDVARVEYGVDFL